MNEKACITQRRSMDIVIFAKYEKRDQRTDFKNDIRRQDRLHWECSRMRTQFITRKYQQEEEF